jgi:hypothetical protein
MAIRAGLTRKDAARHAGLAESTLHRLLGRSGRYELVRDLVERAELETLVEVQSNLFALALRETGAAMFWLHARYPNDWSAMPAERPRRRNMRAGSSSKRHQ